MTDIPLRGKRILLRLDLNVPMQEGQIRSQVRIQAALPTIREALDAGAAVLIMSHLGRPEAGAGRRDNASWSLRPVAQRIGELLGCETALCCDWLDEEPAVEPGNAVVLENVRFLAGETDNDPELGRRMAALCDVFVMDAFAVAHRAHASTCAVARYAPLACAGPLLLRELTVLSEVLQRDPGRGRILAIVGGAKVTSKLALLRNLVHKVDCLAVAGGIANTFLAAAGHPVGDSLCEPELFAEALEISASGDVLVPEDVLVGSTADTAGPAVLRAASEVCAGEAIFDLGTRSTQKIADLAGEMDTVLWNGPLGVFENPRFAAGTGVIAKAVAASPAFTIAGGGDTLAAVEHFQVSESIDFLSTGGGAFLQCLEGSVLPAVQALQFAG